MPKKNVIPPRPMCISLALSGEEVLLVSSFSVAQWKASLSPEMFEDRFSDVLDGVEPRCCAARQNQNN